jgi:hypothetical protein
MLEIHSWGLDGEGYRKLKAFGSTQDKILDYVEELIKTGYDIKYLDPIQEHRRVYHTIMEVREPLASE